MRATTATSALAALVLVLVAAPAAAAGGGVDRLLALAAAYAPAAAGLSGAVVRERCGDDRLCAARAVVAALGPPAELVGVRHPDTDSIRRASNLPSVGASRMVAPGVLRLGLARFGRKATQELIAARDRAGSIAVLELDLRQNGGGDFRRMLDVAALFAGPRPDAVRLSGPAGVRAVAIPAPARRLSVPALRVLVGGCTASSAEVLAALLRRYAGAAILGTRTYGKDYLFRLVPVDADWRLLLPAERIAVVGARIAGGLRPDGPIGAGE